MCCSAQYKYKYKYRYKYKYFRTQVVSGCIKFLQVHTVLYFIQCSAVFDSGSIVCVMLFAGSIVTASCSVVLFSCCIVHHFSSVAFSLHCTLFSDSTQLDQY